MSRILVVDDEQEMVEIIKIILESAGYEVETAYSGHECLIKAEKQKFDLILLDIRMPKMDGWETLKRLKEMDIADGTKIIILTIEKGPGIEIFGFQDVVKDYITKPFDKEDLLKSIRNTLHR